MQVEVYEENKIFGKQNTLGSDINRVTIRRVIIQNDRYVLL